MARSDTRDYCQNRSPFARCLSDQWRIPNMEDFYKTYDVVEGDGLFLPEESAGKDLVGNLA